jgi:hypothetical protein
MIIYILENELDLFDRSIQVQCQHLSSHQLNMINTSIMNTARRFKGNCRKNTMGLFNHPTYAKVSWIMKYGLPFILTITELPRSMNTECIYNRARLIGVGFSERVQKLSHIHHGIRVSVLSLWVSDAMTHDQD